MGLKKIKKQKKIVFFILKGGSGKTTCTLTFADILKGLGSSVDIIELDVQGTIATAAQYGGRHKPIDLKDATSEFLIFDLPPYNNVSVHKIIKTADIVIIPVKVSQSDLLAARQTIDLLEKLGVANKACIVFNEVRKPHSNNYKKVKNYFLKNIEKGYFKGARIVGVELSNLVAYRGILEEEIKGKAFQEVTNLLTELKIIHEQKTNVK